MPVWPEGGIFDLKSILLSFDDYTEREDGGPGEEALKAGNGEEREAGMNSPHTSVMKVKAAWVFLWSHH